MIELGLKMKISEAEDNRLEKGESEGMYWMV
jgi:hypothetical protein